MYRPLPVPVARRFAAACAAAAACLVGSPVLAQDGVPTTPVDVELVLAVDISGSMDYEEQLIQREGYVTAFRDDAVVSAMTSGYHRRIVVTYLEWANEFTQNQAVPWTVIDSPETARAFADAVEDHPLNTARGTSISGALLAAAELIEGNAYEGVKRVIDISGDGSNRNGPPVRPVRDQVAEQGIIINGLPLSLRPSGQRFGPIDLDAYYRENVIAGPGSFVLSVDDFDTLGSSIRSKLILEIADATLWRPRVASGGD